MFDPTTGEKPISELPQYGGTGGDIVSGRYYAAKKFAELFGRNPTASELAMLSSAYAAGDPHIASLGAGDAAVAQYFNSFANSPENVTANQNKKNLDEAPKYYDQINQMFQGTLKRDATQDEKQHFGSLMATGNVDAYTVGQFLNALPENVKKQDEEFQAGLGTKLQSQDSQYYTEQILPALQAQATKQGRSLDASGVQNSLALAAQQQNRQREGFLANITASQYAGSQGLAQDAYARAYGANQDAASYSRQRSDYLTDAYTGRINSLNDYNIQKQAYDQYLKRYGKRSSGMGSGIGSLVGMGLGALLAAPTGGMSIGAGAMLGGMGGGAAGSLFG